MRRLIASSVALLALAGSATAAEMSGRITFVDPDQNLLVLDSSSSFTLGSGIDKAGLQVGTGVNVTYDAAGDQMTATAIELIPVSTPSAPAAPVAGAGGVDAGAGAGGAAGGALGGAAGGAAGGALNAAPAPPAGPAPAPYAAPAP